MTDLNQTRERCQAFVEGGGTPLVRGGARRHRHCARPATQERARSEVALRGDPVMRTYKLCGQHAAQWDKAERGEVYPPNLRSDF